MKLLKAGLLLFIFILASFFKAKANHVAGAQIYYKNIGKYKYEIFVEFFRDCRGTPFTKPNIILKSVNSGDTAKITSYSLVSIIDITPTCASAGKRCTPANTTITTNKYSIEKHTYKATIDLTNWYNKGACKVLIGTGQCCRGAIITTGSAYEDFWVYAMVDLCKWTKNSSPVMFSEPYLFVTCNEPEYYNIAARDTVDHDSLVFEMTDPMKDWTNKASWGSGYSSQVPMTVYWPTGYNKSKGPDPYASIPIGFYLNSKTGQTIFTPIGCTDNGPTTVRISEYHKDSATGKYDLVGYITRDFMFVNYGLTYTPAIKGPNNIYLADSIESSIIYTSTNAVTTWSVGPSKDTIKLKMVLEPELSKGATFTSLNPNQKNPVNKFKWRPLNKTKGSPYFMVFEARDNACELYSLSHKDVTIYVNKKSELAWVEGRVFSDINRNCRRDSFEFPLAGTYISADGGRTVAFTPDSAGYFGGWLPADSFSFKVMSDYNSSYCVKNLRVFAGKTYYFDIAGLSSVKLSGVVYNDSNKNCKADTLEPRLKNHFIYTEPGNFVASTDKNGFWQMNIPAANYKIMYSAKHPYTIVKCPQKPYTVNFASSNDIKNLDMAVFDSSNVKDLSVSIITSNRHRRGYNSTVHLVVKNNGNLNTSGNSVWLKFNKKLKYVSSPGYLLKTDTTVKFAVPALKPDEESLFDILLKADTALKLNDTFTTKAWLDTAGLSKDFVKSNNYDQKTIKIGAAVDPNIKQEQNTNGYAWKNGNKLRYFVQFQNTGTDTAVNITVVDTLHYALSGSTLDFKGASHPYEYTLNGHVLKVTFPNIYLVDTSVSKDKSIGHFEFAIDVDTNQNQELKFYNHAYITFDFAKPVKTNKAYINYISLVQTGPTDKNSYCGKDTIQVKYSSRFKFNAGNKFRLFMSDASGIFVSGAKPIDSLSSTSVNGSFKFPIPSGASTGSNYKLKVVSSNPSGPVYDESLSNNFAIVKTLTKPGFGKIDSLYCGKDSIQLTIISPDKKFNIYDGKTFLQTANSNSPKIKLSVGKHFISVLAVSGSCTSSSDTLKLYSDSLPVVKFSSPSHPNLKLCANDSVTLQIDGGFSSFLLLGTSLAIIDSVNGNKIKVAAPNTNDARTARVTSKYGCQNYSNTLVFTNNKKPLFTFTDSDFDNLICAGDSVKFSVNGKGSIKFQLYKNASPWLNAFKTNLTTNAIKHNDMIKVRATDTLTGCSDTSLPVKFGVTTVNVVLTCNDSDLVICNNTNITLSMSGAGAYMLYKNGKYWITPTGNPINMSGIKDKDEIYAEGTAQGCKGASNKLRFTVLTPDIVISNTDVDNTHCKGDNVTINFSGGASYNLYKNNQLWKPNSANPITFIDVNDKDEIYAIGTSSVGCVDTSGKIKFTVWPLPAKPIITKTGSVLSSNYTFGNQWYEGAGKISGATAQQYSLVKTADYFVSHTDVHGCTSPLSDALHFTAGVSKIKIAGLKVYPNPASDRIVIETGESGHFDLQLYDISGKLVKEESFTGNYFEWQIKPAKGIYRLKTENEKGESEQVTVVFR